MEQGRFDAVAVANTTDALAGLSLGLVGFSVYLFSLRPGATPTRLPRTPSC